MSASAWPREQRCYLKVLFDFSYKTAEGRPIVIRRNERLYLLQKTNADWWQVARNAEQRSFYVPATYVREISNINNNNNNDKNNHKRYSGERDEHEVREEENEEEDDRGGSILRPPEDPSYKSMPKESSNAMRNVKKWLAGGSSYEGKNSARSLCETTETSGGRGLKVALTNTKSKSLERERRTGHASDRDEEASTGSARSRESIDCDVAVHSRYGTSPGSCSSRLEASDPFRRELESSLDRRNLCVKSSASRARTRSVNSEGSNAESEASRDAIVRTDDDEDDDNNGDNDEDANGKRPIYGRQTTSLVQQPPSGDNRILNDKRRTWAVEELMSELTQMCKDRGSAARKPVIQLRSTELKSNFDPIEKLTREIHEMNRARCSEDDETARGKNVSKITINLEGEAKDIVGSPKVPKSPRSPKIMDEWNEANILNDCNNAASASPDKQTRKRSETCYSNLRSERSNKSKLRLRTNETSVAELRLTPSLEKLASEIQFLPAKRSSENEAATSDESLEASTVPVTKLRYKGSLKSKGEAKYRDVFRYAAIPESRPGRSLPRDEANVRMEKRRSRSLSDLGSASHEILKVVQYKPVPLPRTKIPVVAAAPRGVLGSLEASSSLEKRRRELDSSTAVEFKSLLCVSDSGSDNCLQSKELPLSSSADNVNGRGGKSPRKTSGLARYDERGASLSDEQILSSNASSEALHSESEVTTGGGGTQASSQPSPITATRDSLGCTIDLPSGWEQKYDADLGQICFLNERGDKWFSSSDAEGKIYFFEENSNESSWVLPSMEELRQTSPEGETTRRAERVCETSEKEKTGSGRFSLPANNPSIVVPRDAPGKKNPGGDWPHLCDGNNMLVLKEGVINRTKITENGKKLRKNWSTSYAVLTELFLLFFKDAKTFAMMKTSQSSMAKPDISVDLNGALVEPGERASSRKNVYMISTVLGLQVLVQSDNTAVANEWFQDIHGAIRKLPFGFKSQVKALPIAGDSRNNSAGKQPNEINHLEDPKKTTKVSRSRSMKTVKRLDDSLEDLSGSAAERQTKIKAKLRRFFLRRPTVELLVKNGIYKDEPAFGSYLSDVCPPDSPRVPIFVKSCIQVLESNEENMKTDGLYRASGNLSQIQKIRLQVDQYKLEVLAQEEDVHVLAGALKLFFRELKEPLIPSSFFKEAVNASMLKKTSAKIQCFRDIVKSLPPPNYDTLQYLLKHLLRVTSYQEFNRMHIPNLAIVFGPTLMWPAEESANMALDFMQQNLVIECLLSEYNKIFK